MLVQRLLYSSEHTTIRGLYSLIQHMPQNIHHFSQRLGKLTEKGVK